VFVLGKVSGHVGRDRRGLLFLVHDPSSALPRREMQRHPRKMPGYQHKGDAEIVSGGLCINGICEA